MTYRSEQRWQRVMALMLTLMLLLTGYTVPAQAEDWQNLSITLSWTDGAGNPASAMATPVAWSEDRAYWVRVTPEAMAQGMTLTVSDPSGQYTYTTPYGDVLTGVMDAGSAMDSTVMPVEVTAYDGAGNAVAVYHLYVSTQADVPEEPKAEPATAEVQVVYQTVDGIQLGSTTKHCVEGESNEVYAAEIDGYTLAADYSAAVQYVTVNSDGTASPNPVIFYYNAVQVEPATAEVTVQYMTVDGMLLSSQTQWCTEGQSNEVYAAELDGYTLATDYSAAVQYVTVNSDGTASPNPVIFYYNAVQAEPATAEVTVQYMTVDGMLLSSQTQWCTEGQSNEVYAAELDGYTLATDYSAAVQYVTVNSDGTASPNPVVFYYNPVQAEPIPVSATVNVSYVGEDGREVAPSDTITYTANGSYTITAAQAGVDSNLLELISDHEVTVTVTDGVAQPAQVKFVYREKQLPIEPEQPVEPELPVPPTPATIQVYYRNQENQNIAAAQTMTLAGGQTTTVSPERSLVPEGYDADSAQSVTVTVSNEGVATPAEVVFTFARTAVPDVPVPQGEMINRFGTINDAKVAMRTSMDSSGNGNLVSRLKKGTVVYLLREEINDKGQSWTRILMDGQQYFIMTKFIDMMTKADSDAYMAEHYPDNPIPPMTEADLDGGAEPAPQPVTVDVTVRYVTEDGVELDRQTVSVTSDQPMTVTPASDKVAGYVLTSASSVQVTVDAANGTATPSEVVFTYREPEPEVKTAEVKVFYITEDGMELDSQTIVCASDKATIITPTSGKTEGYALVSAGSVEVTVNPQTGAASPSEVSFIYRALPPAEVTVDVTVRYVTEDGVELDRQTTPASSAQAVTITPASDKVAGYVLTSASSVQVTVDAANGTATPSEVVFTYREPEPEVKTAEVKVFYITEDGMELDSQTIVCASDKATIITPTSGKTEGYALVSAGSVEVTVDQQTGAASQSEVRFTYRVLPPATVTVDVPVIYVTEDGAELDRQTITCTSAVPTNIMPTSTKVAGYTLTSASSVQVTVDAATGAADPAEVRFTYARPAQYEGYALTTQAVALRTEISTSDASIIRALSKDTLVYVYGQQYDSSNQAWSTVSTLDEQPGMVLDSALRRITKEEAQYYITLWEEQNQPENTPEPTATPPQVAGKAVTIGDGVMFRQTYDATGAIIAVLPKDTEVEVLGQAYTANGEAWHSVRYSGSLGYIRADMLRFVTNTDAPATTQPTVNPDGLSAYGYVSSSTVNFRKSASTSASRLRVLKQYAMCLVLGTEQVGDTTW
ncbi:MAG: MucBP domain-containing protein, partial [Aristaeellaceae bacterium]